MKEKHWSAAATGGGEPPLSPSQSALALATDHWLECYGQADTPAWDAYWSLLLPADAQGPVLHIGPALHFHNEASDLVRTRAKQVDLTQLDGQESCSAIVITLPLAARQIAGAETGEQLLIQLLRASRDALGQNGVLVLRSPNPLDYSRFSVTSLLRPDDFPSRKLRRCLTSSGFHICGEYTTHGDLSLIEGYHRRRGSAVLAHDCPPGWKQSLKADAFASGVLMMATKSQGNFQNTLESIGSEVGGLDEASALITRKGKLVVELPDARILKIPLTPAALASECNNASTLGRLSTDLPNFPAPRLLQSGSHRACDYFIEQKLSGLPLSQDKISGPEDARLATVVSLLAQLREGAEHWEWARVRDALVYPRLERIVALRNDAQMGDRLLAFLDNLFDGHSLPVGWCHGDFSLSNLLVNHRQIKGLIDWETAHPQDLSSHDFINFLDSTIRSSHSGIRVNESIPGLASCRLLNDWQQQFVSAQMEALQLHPSLFHGLVYLRWLRHVAYLSDFWLAADPAAQRVYIDEVVASLP